MRRILVPRTILGRIDLGPSEAHHLRDVLRLSAGAELEVFDKDGTTGHAQIASVRTAGVTVEVDRILGRNAYATHLTIASAVPKGPRADWMIEKLSELGVDAFLPLSTRHSIVAPQGSSKHTRWHRLAAESARQSARPGIMQIAPLAELPAVLESPESGTTLAYLSLEPDARPILELAAAVPPRLTLLIGPEGGWSPDELAAFHRANIPAYRLTHTILRVETAAVAAAAIIQSADLAQRR